MVGEFQQGNLVVGTENAAEQLDFNLSEQKAECPFILCSVLLLFSFRRSLDNEIGQATLYRGLDNNKAVKD